MLHRYRNAITGLRAAIVSDAIANSHRVSGNIKNILLRSIGRNWRRSSVRLLRRSFVRTVVGAGTSDLRPGVDQLRSRDSWRVVDASLRAEVSRGEAVTNLETNGGPVDSPFKITA